MAEDWRKDPVKMAAAVKKRLLTRKRNARLRRTKAHIVIERAVKKKDTSDRLALKNVIKELQRRREKITTTIATLQEVMRG